MAARASGKWQFHLGSLNQCWVLQTNSFHLSLLASVEHCLRHHQEQQKDGAADDENKRESNGKIYIYIYSLHNYSGCTLVVCSTVLVSKRVPNKCVNGSKHAFKVWLVLGNTKKRALK